MPSAKSSNVSSVQTAALTVENTVNEADKKKQPVILINVFTSCSKDICLIFFPTEFQILVCPPVFVFPRLLFGIAVFICNSPHCDQTTGFQETFHT